MDSLIICPRCTSNACYETKTEDLIAWHCFGCGFISNTNWKVGEVDIDELVKGLPELWKDLKYVDEKGYVWVPSNLNEPEKGMIFVDGKTLRDWKWAAVLSTKIKREEKGKFPKDQKYRVDMKTIQYFEERDYMEALDYIGFFNKM